MTNTSSLGVDSNIVPEPSRSKLSELQSLLAKVEGASGADRELDRLIECALFGGTPMPRDPGRVRRVDGKGYGYTQAFACHTATLDAALVLVERCLPGHKWDLRFGRKQPEALHAETHPDFGEIWRVSCGATPALALLAAMLKALEAQHAEG